MVTRMPGVIPPLSDQHRSVGISIPLKQQIGPPGNIFPTPVFCFNISGSSTKLFIKTLFFNWINISSSPTYLTSGSKPYISPYVSGLDLAIMIRAKTARPVKAVIPRVVK